MTSLRSLSTLTLALALVTLGAAGCGDDDGGTTPRDAGGGGSDAGRDTGPPPGDGGGGFDAGEDRGTCDDPFTGLPAVALPRCEADTQGCIVACATATDPDMCRAACYAADMTAPLMGVNCELCGILQLFACGDRMGCHAGVANLLCCLADMCPAGSPPGCPTMMCGEEITALLTCIGGMAPSCADPTMNEWAMCFSDTPTVDGGAPPEDAGPPEVDAGP